MPDLQNIVKERTSIPSPTEQAGNKRTQIKEEETIRAGCRLAKVVNDLLTDFNAGDPSRPMPHQMNERLSSHPLHRTRFAVHRRQQRLLP
jgi:hypothetical protein